VLLDASDSHYDIEHHCVASDYQGEIDAVERSRRPAGDYITQHFRRPRSQH
jgi:hypothetical protein